VGKSQQNEGKVGKNQQKEGKGGKVENSHNKGGKCGKQGKPRNTKDVWERRQIAVIK